MTIEEFLRMLLRNALLLIITLGIGLAAGFGYSYTIAPTYQASAKGFVKDATGAGEDGEDQKYSQAQFYLPLFNTRAVGEAIQEKTGIAADPDTLSGTLTASIDPNAPILTVIATANTPEDARAIANASVEAVSDEAGKLNSGYRNGLAMYETSTGSQQIGPNRKLYAAAGAALGLALGMLLAWLRNRNDSRVRTVDDIRSAVAVPALGVLPEAKDFTRKKDGLQPEPTTFQSREALRKLRTNLQFVDVDNPPRSVVVTSSAPAEGKSTVSVNLSRVMARSGRPTLLIDADLRRPVVAKELGLDGSVGLSQLLAGTVALDDVIQEVPGSSLLVLPAGKIPPNPSELLGSRRMRDLIHELSREHFVVLDAPPVLAVTDAQLLSRHTDGAILVAVPGRTRVEGLTRAVEAIRHVAGNVLGVVMNRASSGRLNRIAYGDAEYGYSSYGYGSYSKKYGYESHAEQDTLEESPLVPDVPESSADTDGSHAAGRRSGRRAASTDEDSAQ